MFAVLRVSTFVSILVEYYIFCCCCSTSTTVFNDEGKIHIHTHREIELECIHKVTNEKYGYESESE